jgi:DNA-binding LacI/PurR family transcriptional regulator
MQVEHLAERGHRRLAVLTTDHPLLRVFARPRLEAAQAACQRLGLPAPRVVTLHDPDETAQARLVEELQRWGDDPDAPTAAVAFNDLFAAACLAAAREAGVDVPGRLAVIGVDDLTMSRFTTPPLTRIALDLEESARDNVEQVRRVLAGKPVQLRRDDVFSALVVRQST